MALGAAEIRSFVRGVCDQTITDAQIAAFAMATWFRGMEPEEQMELTLAMRDSGAVLHWPDLDGPVVDKHSTGGVGDMVSLILAPLMAACGAFVPMISGRGLGHTGGTLDKLESIPGLQTEPGIETFRRWVTKHRLAIVGQSSDLVPADRRIYAVRDETATVASVPLIVSSILSKKLAEGLDALVVDVKSGGGAFMEQLDQAQGLAREIHRIAGALGLPCAAVITDMDQPLAWSAGNALEVREAIAFLRGDARHERLNAVVLELSTELLQLAGLARNRAEGLDLAGKALDSGSAAEAFAAMVHNQGGPARLLEDADSFLSAARVCRPVFSGEAAYVQRIDTRAVGMIVVELGGGRRKAGDPIDPAVGLSALVRVGEFAGPDEPLAVVHAASEESWEVAAKALIDAIKLAPEPPQSRPVVISRSAPGHEM